MAGWQTGLASIGNDIWGGTKKFGDTIGLDGKFGYNNSWDSLDWSDRSGKGGQYTNSWSPEQWQEFGAGGGTVGNGGELISGQILNADGNAIGGGQVIGQMDFTPGVGDSGAGKGLAGLGDAFSLGKGIFDIWSAIDTKGFMKDYYGNQTRLANEQMAMYKEDRDNIAQDKKEYTAAYGR